jgi:hypothetical protein
MSNARVARQRDHELGSRVCGTCEVRKPFSEFFRSAHQDSSGIPRYRAECKPCHQERTNVWRAENAELLQARRRASAERRYRKIRLQKYGLTEEGLATLEAEADGKCPICFREARLVVDHCHATGRVRSLLCPSCNQALGLLQEDPERMIRAAGYIQRHRES